MVYFKPRTKAPAKNSRYWITVGAGGYNRCIVISGVSVLPNCVGYAYGRFMEECGRTSCNLSTADAERWYATKDGYGRGNVPKLGAVICWRKGSAYNANDGHGHVGIVEQINADDTILVSMSSYGGDYWYTRKFKIGYYDYNGLIFQGFIYNPYVETKTEQEDFETELDKIALAVIHGDYGVGAERKAALTKAGYNYVQVQSRVNELMHVAKSVIRGVYGNGNVRKQKLRSAGYDYDVVQKVVNMLYG